MGNPLKLNLKSAAPVAAYDNLFGNDYSGEQVAMLPIDLLLDYPNQPFHPYKSDKLWELADDIARNGILSPLIVRSYDNGYQIMAGHNRKNAAKLAGLSEVPCIIKENCDNDTAAIIVVNTNLNQREELLPSEKAFAYKMQIEALKKQGVHNVRTTAELADAGSESKRNIQYYLRLTLLIPELLQMVDDGHIPFRAGVNLSYVASNDQKLILSFMKDNSIAAISLNQSEHIKHIANIDERALMEVFNLSQAPKDTRGKIGVNSKRVLHSYFNGSNHTDDEIADILEEALKQYFVNNG